MTTSRRAFLAALALAPVPFAAVAEAGALDRAIAEATGGRTPTDGGVTLSAPTVAENGGQVPVTVTVESPQDGTLHVTAIHLFATRNPTPGVASFRLTRAVAKPEVTTRIRLAEEQVVVAIAELSDGTLRRATASVRVTTGGCLS
ncbi:thiosulfate oxidation carrier protein SoxY [Elioraea rosea]|uniref:thiosulfate oxidation carrier protein SoxY n=1 Tax=Elioraea rosea TaxID=2492390 RepID=UPI0011840F79|nr:thiosulfate oxidation carrier protein SoxY [Elioraea rosea]